ncbi:MAG: nuclear transport factor 2 family protein [Acidobacteria bacterium]|nr:nuclear transport factor 2 family protein [Acidobacteriota bacterium]MBI3427311.1 nuclear transport factor 2 family protein [Acidobacteriota bacterium]
MNEQDDRTARKANLRKIVEAYFEAWRRQDFAAIPYATNVCLRAPLAPGGVHQPLRGIAALREHWWAPLELALAGVGITILDCYFNAALTAVCAEALITLNALAPPITLRVADRFTVNEAGEISEQENHFDPRDVTNPGWHNS